MIQSTGFPRPMLVTGCQRSITIQAGKPFRRQRPSIFSRANCWAAFRENSACENIWKARVISWWLLLIRMGRILDLSVSCSTQTSSYRSPFGLRISPLKGSPRPPKLKLAVTAGIGSDHVDLQAAIDHGITVAEVTYSNSISVSEHAVMMILGLVRNYIPSHEWIVKGGWNIADCVARSYDVEGMHVGTVAAGRIGTAILRRLKPFDVHLHYFDRQRLPEAIEKELNVVFHPTVEEMVKICDVVTINAPLHPQTENLFDDALLSKMKRGAYIVNTARAKICNRDAIVRALESGQLAGYAGDVWFPQPPPNDHPWRTMPHHGMTPHISGSSLAAEARYAAGTREILECWFEGRPIRNEYLIVDGGKLAGAGAHSYSAGNATSGSEDAARLKTKV
jgi:formate dehydrogenase